MFNGIAKLYFMRGIVFKGFPVCIVAKVAYNLVKAKQTVE